MFPTLFEVFGFQVPAYGVILALDFLLCLYALRYEAKRRGLDPIKTGDAALTGLLFGLLGAKLLLYLIDLPYYIENPDAILRTLRSAGVIYGGQFGGALGVIFYIRKHKLPFWATLDLMAPFLALGMALGRFACIAAGCCYGFNPYEGPLAFHYLEHPRCEAPIGVGVFPVQLLDLVLVLIVAVVLLLVSRRSRFPGQTTSLLAILYALTRFGGEFLRGDDVRGRWFGNLLSTSQVIALVAILLGIWLYFRQLREHQHGTH